MPYTFCHKFMKEGFCKSKGKSMEITTRDKILINVQKTTRYTGGELNEVKKDPNTVDIRFALCFPDT